MTHISPGDLRVLLRYDPETGSLFWNERPAEFFFAKKRPAEWVAKIWNKKYSGAKAFTAINNGYLFGDVMGSHLYAHRVIWAMSYDDWPEDQIDHINGVRTDNRLINLRAVNQFENSRNVCINSRNISGTTGVSFYNKINKWVSSIGGPDGNPVYLGSYGDIKLAISSRKEAEKFYGYHENHGRKT